MRRKLLGRQVNHSDVLERAAFCFAVLNLKLFNRLICQCFVYTIGEIGPFKVEGIIVSAGS